MQRVMIVGQPGSGKSTLARTIGTRTGLPVYHMDHIHWMSGWQERAKPAKIALANEIEAKDAWVFEGGLSATYQNRVARADTLIVLDFGLIRRSWRVAKRTIWHFGRTRPDLPYGCPEQFSGEFWHFIWRTRHSARAALHRLMANAPDHVTIYHLTRPKDVASFIEGLDPIG